MVSQSSSSSSSSELYNLRWNSYHSNLVNVFTDHQIQETLVDITLGCEGQFVKAHRLVLSACSTYFQKIFQNHTSPNLLILLNDVKFENLRLVVQFMYKGEVKVADADMQQFLQLGKMLQVKGLCSVELQDKQKTQTNGDTKVNTNREPSQEKTTTEKRKSPDKQTTENKNKHSSTTKAAQNIQPKHSKEAVVPKKRKLPSLSPPPPEVKKKTVVSANVNEPKDASIHIPRPPNAFMIFANQWRKKLAVEYPNESNKDISVRLGYMWKSLSPETKDAFYEDARKADEEHKAKYPGYSYSPQEARNRKVIATIAKTTNKLDTSSDSNDSEFIEIKFEEVPEDTDHSTSPQ